MAAEIILRVKVDKSEYKAFKDEVAKGLDPSGTNKVKDSLKKTGDEAKQATTKIQSLGEMLTKKIAWYSISMAITSVTTAFKEALTEIKAVDTQLTNIAKVSGKSMEDLQGLAEKAYSTASKYGVEASKYMEAVYEYTKAGFKENADAMGELSTKAMLVGDTTASVADKFLIAANAAWKYNENLEELTLLVDKADYINNNYATTFEKIADGFPRVASVASMAGMSAEETMAALGTITATTQETASRAGTALRALILNILGDTTTEVEDGVKNTQEEIDSLRAVMELYAKDVVDAADATGKLINPMEALKSLSEAYKRGDLTDRGLFQIEKALGGKLRTNQLDALLKNFDKYEEMLIGMASAAGTADKEIETMLGSWESKTQILKNTWTEFVSKGFDSSFFKDKIDWLTKLIDRFDGLNEVLPIAIGYMAALFSPMIAANIQKFVNNISNLKTAFGSGFRTLNEQTGKMELNWGAIGTAASLAITAITTAYTLYENHMRKIRQGQEEATEKAIEEADKAKTNADNILALYASYKTAEKGTTEYTAAVEGLSKALGLEKEAIEGVNGALEENVEKQLQSSIDGAKRATEEAKRGILTIIETLDGANGNLILAKGRSYELAYDSGTNLVKTVAVSDEERIRRIVQQYKTYVAEINALKAAYNTENYKEIQNKYLAGDINSNELNMAGYYRSKMTDEAMRKRITELEGFLKETEYVQTYIDQLEKEALAVKALEDFKNGNITLEEYTDTVLQAKAAEEETEQSAEELAAAQQKLADAFKDVTGQAVDATNALNKYNDAISADQAEENADAWVNAAKAAHEAIINNLVDSAEVKAFADSWFNSDQIAKFKKEGISTAEALINDQNFSRIFIKGTDENGETVFKSGIESAKELVKMFDEFDDDNNGMMMWGDTIAATLEDTDSGIRVVVEDWEALSQAMGINEDTLRILLNAYGLLIPGLEASTADLLAFAEAAGAVTESIEGIKEVDLAKVISDAFAQGATQDTVWDLVNALQEAQERGDLKLVVDEEEVQNANEVAQELIGKLDDVVDADHVIDVDDKELSQAVTMADNLRIKLDNLDGKTVTIHVAVNGNGAGSEKVKTALDEWIKKDSIFASGTNSAPGGMALVNEEGAELIAANGMAWIVGGGRPSVAPIPKGAKIWTAKETKAILSNSNLAPLFGGIQAFADGTNVPSEIANVPKKTLWEDANLFAQDYEDNELKGLQGIVSLRKSELEILKQNGASVEEQNEKQKQIQEAIVDVVRKLQNVGGKQEDINQLAAEWYQIENSISETEEQQAKEKEEQRKQRQEEKQQALADDVSLHKSELDLLEAKGSSTAKQIAKQREIQESLMKQVRYLKRIGGDQKEINGLLTEYYNIDKQITEEEKRQEEQKKQKAENKKQRQKEREEKLYDNLQASIQKHMEKINKNREEELSLVDEQLKKLREEHEIQQENQELQEKQLAVEKAREALENAKKQRTVRIFNASTGKWEWTYNASTVNSAREEYKNARESLRDYKKEQAYQERIDALEAEQQEINNKYDAKIAKWQAVLDTMEKPVRSIKSTLKSIEKHATENMLPTIEKMNEALQQIGDGYVISPEIQKKMMGGTGSGQSPANYRTLGGVPTNVAGTPYGVGTQYNGDSYTFGNITLSEQQARTTTVYELSQMAGGLRSYAYGT